MENSTKLTQTINVVIPVYNGADFILEALESVVNQTLSPNIIIVVDDGSTDDTNKIVSEYAKNSKIQIKVIKKENGGLSSARNIGIKESSADLIAFLDADDVWVNDKLEKQIEIFNLSEFLNLGLVYCKYDLLTPSGTKDTKGYIVPLDKKIRGNVFKKMLKTNKILSSGSGVLIKRNVFDIVGIFDETLKFGEDWDMWIRIAEKFEIDYTEKILVHIRRHPNSMSHYLSNVFLGEIGFYNKWIPKLKGHQTIPLEWSDRIIFRIIKMFPKTGLIKELKSNMSKEAYGEMFTKKFKSIYVYFFIFIVRTTIKVILSPSQLLKVIK
ncbi:MAG: glycosyltransferase family A protein [Candidatus Paceibacterota bacterium]|jgi:glycosyltransferase involved in cell wall biosynthesis